MMPSIVFGSFTSMLPKELFYILSFIPTFGMMNVISAGFTLGYFDSQLGLADVFFKNNLLIL
jgi:hypothetical protein